jgi:hypothetical protein
MMHPRSIADGVYTLFSSQNQPFCGPVLNGMYMKSMVYDTKGLQSFKKYSGEFSLSNWFNDVAENLPVCPGTILFISSALFS